MNQSTFETLLLDVLINGRFLKKAKYHAHLKLLHMGLKPLHVIPNDTATRKSFF